MRAFLNQFALVWQSRAPREQRIIALAGAVLLGAAIFLGVYEPAAKGIADLRAALPASQAQAAQLEQLAQQIQSQPKRAASDYASNASIQASLDGAGIKASVSSAAPWLVTVNSAAGESLWQWLKTAPVSSSAFKRNETGVWQGSATLAP